MARMDSRRAVRWRAPCSGSGRCVVVFMYLPSVASRSPRSPRAATSLPDPKWGFDWWQKTFNSFEIHADPQDLDLDRALVTVIAVVLAFFGALAFARYDWKGRSLYQKLVLLPIFFPQSVLGLALLLWFNALGLTSPGRRRCSRIWSGSCRW